MKILRIYDLHYSMFIFIVDKINKEECKKIEDFGDQCLDKRGRPKIYWIEENI